MNRRSFLARAGLAAGAGVVGAGMLYRAGTISAELFAESALPATSGASTVALTRGASRRATVAAALDMLRDEIRQGIGNRQVVIKPNNVRTEPKLKLGMTHVDALRGVLDFLKPIYDRQVIIAENCGVGPGDTPIGYRNLGYPVLEQEYNCKLADLADYRATTIRILDPDFRPQPLNISRLVVDPDAFIISLGIPKVHVLAGVTLSVKNMAVGSPVDGRNEKVKMHPQVLVPGFHDRPRDPNFNKMFNYNLFQVATYVRPAVAVLDGWEGMERQGPTGGDPVPLHCAIASTDWLSTDRVATELMGIPFEEIPHLRYCAEANLGHSKMADIRVIGERIAAVKKPFVRMANYDQVIVV